MSFLIIEIHCQGNISLFTHLLHLAGVPLFDLFPSAFVLPHVNFKLLLIHLPGLVSAPQILMWFFQAASCAVLGALDELGQSPCSSHWDQDRKWLRVWAGTEPRTCVGLSSSFVSFLMDSPTHCVLLVQLLQQLPGQPHFISFCGHLFLSWLRDPDFLLLFSRWVENCKQPSPLILSSVRHLVFLNCVFPSFLICFDIYTFPPYNNVSIWQLYAVKTANFFL